MRHSVHELLLLASLHQAKEGKLDKPAMIKLMQWKLGTAAFEHTSLLPYVALDLGGYPSACLYTHLL